MFSLHFISPDSNVTGSGCSTTFTLAFALLFPTFFTPVAAVFLLELILLSSLLLFNYVHEIGMDGRGGHIFIHIQFFISQLYENSMNFNHTQTRIWNSKYEVRAKLLRVTDPSQLARLTNKMQKHNFYCNPSASSLTLQ